MTASLRSVARWVARHDDGAALELVCAEHPAPSRGDPARTVVRLTTCLAEAPAHEVLELFTAGAGSILLRRDGCTQPETVNAGLEEAAHVLAAAGLDRLQIAETASAGSEAGGDGPRTVPSGRRTRLLGRPRTARSARREVLDAEHMPVPRRQVLGLGAGPARELADDLAPAQRRFTAALAALLPAASPAALCDPTLLSPALRLRGKGCTACGVCVRACPMEALTLRHTGSRTDAEAPLVTTLLQNPTSCDGCQVCVRSCPEDVLTIAGRWGWESVLSQAADPEAAPVASLTTALCQRCRTRFPTTQAGNLCPVCAYRRENPFSSRMPPGA